MVRLVKSYKYHETHIGVNNPLKVLQAVHSQTDTRDFCCCLLADYYNGLRGVKTCLGYNLHDARPVTLG